MSLVFGKKLFFILGIVFLLIMIPISLYLISKNIKNKTTIIPSAVLSFSPKAKNVNGGENVTLNINLDPGTNSITLLKLKIIYDKTKLSLQKSGLVINSEAFPLAINEPDFRDGSVSINIGVGSNNPPITKSVKIGSLTFITLSETNSVIQVSFSDDSKALSQDGRNLLARKTFALLNISPQQTNSQIKPTPANLSSSPNLLTNINTSSASSLSNSFQNRLPNCISFTADRPTTGTSPFNVNFTLKGTSAALVSKATFNFGDGQTKDLLSESGAVSGNSINSLAMHVYETAGTYTASGTITDINGNTSSIENCSITVNISASIITSGITNAPSPTQLPTAYPTTGISTAPSLPPTGSPGMVSLVLLGIIFIFLGAVIVFAV